MSGIDIAVVVIVAVLALCAFGYLLWRRLKGKRGCCDCDCCGENAACKLCQKVRTHGASDTAPNTRDEENPDCRCS